MLFLGFEEILNYILILLLILLSFFGTGQLLDEEYVDDLYELILYQFIVYEVQDFGRNSRVRPVLVFVTTQYIVVKVFFQNFLKQGPFWLAYALIDPSQSQEFPKSNGLIPAFEKLGLVSLDNAFKDLIVDVFIEG